ncbi:MAG: formate--tetrahydrofolate ligase, partial [Eubacterium sp.]|nr:formate--tetrahydrofolate ligase [Eubacterium sp.]
KFGVPCIVALNHILTDTDAEIAFVKEFCESKGAEFALADVWADGGEGGRALAEKVVSTIENRPSEYHPLYPDEMPLKEKIETIATEIYGAGRVEFSAESIKQLEKLTELGFGSLPVCMAKNQYSLSDDKSVLGRPINHVVHIREVYVSAGAGFVVALTGTIVTMPGLPKVPAAEHVDVDENGRISGLF